ncbi:hypothetical protein MPSEU_000221700 [Mayamaea pseudoterrestris]|nr:hypothetical protein MPSEU_000221700 [Mayamaea pseudoterrestris]
MMNASSPVAMRIRTPLSSPQSKHRHDSTSPPRYSPSRFAKSRFTIGPSLMVRLLLPCTLPLLLITQWVLQTKHMQQPYDLILGSSSSEDAADGSLDSSDSELIMVRANTSTLQLTSLVESSRRAEPNEAELLQQEQQDRLYSAQQQDALPSLSFPFVRDSKRPLSVAWVAGRSNQTDPVVSYLDDALDRSKYMQLVQRVDYTVDARIRKVDKLEAWTPMVYVIDWASLERDCHVLERLFLQQNSGATLEDNAFLFYHDTTNSARVVQCRNVDEQFSGQRVFYAKQSIVQDRYWNATLQWIEPGSLLDGLVSETTHQATILYAPQTLSEVFVHRIDTALARRKRQKVLDTLPSRHRPIDVVVMSGNASCSHYGSLREHVTKQVLQHAMKQNYTVKLIGEPNEVIVNDTLIDDLMTAKIAVFAQPDEWQETTGMLEAMASGALVVSDRVLQPTYSASLNHSGLVDEQNVLFYNDISSLLQILDDYLENGDRRKTVVKAGWEYSMGTRRSWQGMETLLFGSPGTHAGQPFEKAPSRRHATFNHGE